MQVEEALHSLFPIDMGQKEEQIQEQLFAQMSSVGFCLITNVPGHDEKELLEAMKAFHGLPQEVKNRLTPNHLNPENVHHYRGYFPFLQGDPSLKEFYDMPRPLAEISEWERAGCHIYEEIPWVKDPSTDWIMESFQAYHRRMRVLSLRLIRLFALGFGKSKDYFDAWFEKECSCEARFIHYKPREESTKEQLSEEHFKLVTPEHSDSGFITLLSTFGYPGLQVEIEGEYRSIQPVDNAIVVNLGRTLSKISGEKYKATMHRVLDIGRERYSSPFFMNPKFSARLSDDLLQSARSTCEDPLYEAQHPQEMAQLDNFGDFLQKRMTSAYVEWKGFQIRPTTYDYSSRP